MCPETQEHLQIKELVLESLRKKYGLGLNEYPDSGNIADVYVVTSDGIEIFVENVWTASKSNFYRDLHILRNSQASVKIFIVNPEIISDKQLEREFDKVRISEIKKGISISKLIDGNRILNERDYVNQEFTQTVDKLVTSQRIKPANKKWFKELLKHSENILLTRSDYQGLDCWYQGTLIQNLLIHGNEHLEIICLLKHFETGYPDKLWKPLIEYKQIMEKYGYLNVPCLGDFQEKMHEESYHKPTLAEENILIEAQKQFLNYLNEIIFSVQNGVPLRGSCNVCSIFTQ
jgi:hypothetical protein